VTGGAESVPAELEGDAHVLWVSDGAGLGGADAQAPLIAAARQHHARGGVLSVVARVVPGLDDALLDQVAQEGGGSYDALVPGEERHLAARLLLPGVTHALAEVRFDASAVSRWRLVGHESRVTRPPLVPERAGGGFIPAGDGVHLLFEVKLAGGPRSLGSVRVQTAEAAVAASLDPAPADDVHHAVVAIAAFAEKLRGSYWAKDIAWEQLERAIGALPSPALKSELGDLLSRARALWSASPIGIERPLASTRWLP